MTNLCIKTVPLPEDEHGTNMGIRMPKPWVSMLRTFLAEIMIIALLFLAVYTILYLFGIIGETWLISSIIAYLIWVVLNITFNLTMQHALTKRLRAHYQLRKIEWRGGNNLPIIVRYKKRREWAEGEIKLMPGTGRIVLQKRELLVDENDDSPSDEDATA